MRVTQQLQLTSEKDSANIPHFGASDVVPAFVCYFLGSFKIAHHSSDSSDATMALLFSCTNFHRDVLNWELHSSFSAIPFLLFIITSCLFTGTKFDFLCQIFMTQSEIR